MLKSHIHGAVEQRKEIVQVNCVKWRAEEIPEVAGCGQAREEEVLHCWFSYEVVEMHVKPLEKFISF